MRIYQFMLISILIASCASSNDKFFLPASNDVPLDFSSVNQQNAPENQLSGFHDTNVDVPLKLTKPGTD